MQITATSREPGIPLPLQAHPCFARSLIALDQDARALTVSQGGIPIAYLVVVRRRFLGVPVTMVTRGPVWCPDATVQARTGALRHLGLALVEPDAPVPDMRLSGYRQILTPAHVAELDLVLPCDQRLKSCFPNWRNALRKAEQAGLTVDADTFDPRQHGWLLEAESAQRTTRRYRSLPLDFTRAFAQNHPGQAIVFTARQNNSPVAAMLMLCHGLTATYYIGWSGPQGRAMAAHQLLLARAAGWLADRGHVRLDLGTVDTDANPGLARFKIGSGAIIRPLGGSWVRVPGLKAGR